MTVTMPWVPGGWVPVPGFTTSRRTILVMRWIGGVIDTPLSIRWSGEVTAEPPRCVSGGAVRPCWLCHGWLCHGRRGPPGLHPRDRPVVGVPACHEGGQLG